MRKSILTYMCVERMKNKKNNAKVNENECTTIGSRSKTVTN